MATTSLRHVYLEYVSRVACWLASFPHRQQQIYFTNCWLVIVSHQLHKKIMTWLFLASEVNRGERRNPLKKRFISEYMIFQGPRLSLGHFGQQGPESPVSQLQNSVSITSLPPFFVDLLTFKDYPRSNSFFQWEI